VTDSNGIVEGAWWLDSAEWRVLLYRARAGAVRLIVPEVVVREVVGRYKAALRRDATAAASARKKLQRLTHDVPAQDTVAVDLEAKTAEYETFLRGTLERNGALVLPLPEIDVSDLVDRAVQRRRPFDENGSGFRDCLLWETVVNELRDSTHTDLTLVSRDGKAFQESKGSSLLHPDLYRELTSRDILGRVTLVDSLAEYFSTLENGNATLTAQIISDLESHEEQLIERAEEQLVLAELSSASLPLVTVSVVEVSDTTITFDSATEPAPGEKLVLISLTVESNLILDIPEISSVHDVRVGSVVVPGHATYNLETQEFEDLEVDLPGIDDIPELRDELGASWLFRTSLVHQPVSQFTATLSDEMRHLVERTRVSPKVLDQIRQFAEQVAKQSGNLEQIRRIAAQGAIKPEHLEQIRRLSQQSAMSTEYVEQVRRQLRLLSVGMSPEIEEPESGDSDDSTENEGNEPPPA
jgi:hypothetical protein